MSELTWVDYGIIVLIGLSSIIGLSRGLFREVLSLLAWVVAIWAAFAFNEQLAPFFNSYINEVSLRRAAAFATLFLGTLFGVGIVNFALGFLIDNTGLGATDRLLGLLFGVIRGGLVVSLLVLLAGFTPFPKDSWWSQSHLIGRFEEMAKWGRDRLPEEVRRLIIFSGESRPTGTVSPVTPGGSPIPSSPTSGK